MPCKHPSQHQHQPLQALTLFHVLSPQPQLILPISSSLHPSLSVPLRQAHGIRRPLPRSPFRHIQMMKIAQMLMQMIFSREALLTHSITTRNTARPCRNTIPVDCVLVALQVGETGELGRRCAGGDVALPCPSYIIIRVVNGGLNVSGR